MSLRLDLPKHASARAESSTRHCCIEGATSQDPQMRETHADGKAVTIQLGSAEATVQTCIPPEGPGPSPAD